MKNLCCLLLMSIMFIPNLVHAGLFEDALSGDEETSKIDTESGEEADAPSSSSGFAASAGGFNFELNGYLRGDLYVGKMPDEEAAEVKSGFGEAALKLRVRKNPYGDAYGELRFRSGYESGEMKFVPDLREAYLNIYAGPFDFRLGHQIVVWGRADGFNPTDNLTPKDSSSRSPNEDDRRIANFGLRTFLNLDPVRIEAVWMPFFRESKLPDFPLSENIVMREAVYPDTNLKNGTMAARLHLETPSFDMSLSYLYGHSNTPALLLKEVDLSNGFPPTVGVALTAYRHQVIGFDFSASVKDWFGLRGEAAYKRPWENSSNSYVPEQDIQYVLGIDREFANGNASFILQYIGKYVFDWQKRETLEIPTDSTQVPQALIMSFAASPENTIDKGIIAPKNSMIAGQTEEVQHSVSLRLEGKFLHETLKLEAVGLLNISTLEWMLRPKLTYDISDGFSFLVGGEIFMGPDDSFYGSIDEMQSAGYVEAIMYF